MRAKKKKKCPRCRKFFFNKTLGDRKSKYCGKCRAERMYENYAQQLKKKGPFYDKWRKGILKGVSK